MTSRLVRIDTNLLLILIVGLVNVEILPKHARTKKYVAADFDLLADSIGDARVILLPNIVTETHNLLAQHKDPERTRLLDALKHLMIGTLENYVPSRVIAAGRDYDRLGVTDAAILKIRTPRLLTDDFGLYRRAALDGQDARNFTHMRIEAGIIPAL